MQMKWFLPVVLAGVLAGPAGAQSPAAPRGSMALPVDPQLLVDFLTLPVSPMPRRAATALVESLVGQPGLGSAAWDAAIAELCSPENDADGKGRARIDAWLNCARMPRTGD